MVALSTCEVSCAFTEIKSSNDERYPGLKCSSKLNPEENEKMGPEKVACDGVKQVLAKKLILYQSHFVGCTNRYFLRERAPGFPHFRTDKFP